MVKISDKFLFKTCLFTIATALFAFSGQYLETFWVFPLSYGSWRKLGKRSWFYVSFVNHRAHSRIFILFCLR